MYENRRGDRLTLYVRCGEKHQDTAFRFAQNGDVGGFYWTDGGYGYALAGRMERRQTAAPSSPTTGISRS